jgi:predicted phage baseplate assembly protein
MNEQTGTSHTDLCGCCEGLAASTPVEVYNRPGLAAIAYRVGTHALFKESMLARLSASDLPALRGLNTRDDDDFAVALADAWAMVADVLTFYEERIANESYLRTATERGSLLELARLIGYEPRPGVAASAYLAFELESVPGSPLSATIDAGTKVQSLPGQDELPQTFETGEKIEARPEWNALRPRQTEPKLPGMEDTAVYLQGLSTGLSPGDALLFVGSEREAEAGSERWDFRRVKTVTAEPEAGRTRVTWDEGLGWRRFDRTTQPAQVPRVYALRLRAALFGHNAPDWRSMLDDVKVGYLGSQPGPDDTEWPGFGLSSGDTIHLDAVYPQVLPGSWLVLSVPEEREAYQVVAAVEESRTDFTLTAKTSRLTLRGESLRSKFGDRLRDTSVFAQSEPLEIAESPILDPVDGDVVALDRRVDGLAEGRVLVFAGEDAGSGEPRSESAVLREAKLEGGLTKLYLAAPLAHAYRRDALIIHANVAAATHGETREEVLGSGDAGAAYQRFTLSESPLTYVRAATPGGAASTLEVRVDDVLWREVPSLYGRGPNERVFATRRDDSGKTTVQFGDGRTGARPPTGQENVRANYRKGIGLEGTVGARQLSLLLTRPLGVRGVSNPGAATDAADPEPRDEVRRNAPLTVLTLDRVVSLQDHEDFARAYAGISKALATWVWDGEARGVFVTVAGPGGSVPGGDLLAELSAAMRGAGDPHHPLFVEPFRPALFHVEAGVKVHGDFLPERVLPAVEESLRARFSFEARSFGESVALSEVIAVVQEVPGVVAVDVNAFYREPGDDIVPAIQRTPARLNPRLDATGPQVDASGSEPLGAELLMLDPGPLGLGEMP